jgi:excisionase family DNA binding protein
MARTTHDPRQLALQTGVTESRSLRAAQRNLDKAPVAVPPPLGSSELGSCDVGLIGALAAVLAEEVAARLAPHLERTPPELEALRLPAAGAWLTVDEVSRMARVSQRTVYRALRSGALAGEKVGALWRIRPAAVEGWAKARPASPDPRAATPAGARVSGSAARPRRGRALRPVSYRARVREGTA